MLQKGKFAASEGLWHAMGGRVASAPEEANETFRTNDC
jgi:hypothetical protein